MPVPAPPRRANGSGSPPSAPRLSVAFLGSGSSGNATAVCFGGFTALVDCGFSARETVRRLVACGVDPASLGALLLTHEHGDHVRGAEVLSRRLALPLLATEGTRRRLPTVLAERVELVVAAGCEYPVGPLRVRPFATSHDVAEPVGYAVSAPGGGAVGIATDTGELAPDALDELARCDLVGLEANHDVDMLRDGPYPAFLKRRILSARGHLSNAAAGAALPGLAEGRVRRVVAMHLSRTNNTPRTALGALSGIVASECLPLQVGHVGQAEPLTFEVTEGAA